jgi:hypothetical protein
MLKRLLPCALAALALQGCTGSGQRQVFHSFNFDGLNDGWYSGPQSNVQLQEYSYGDQYRMVRDKVKAGDEFLPPTTSVSGPMPIGEFLYVRWRLKDSGEMIEHRVDLRDRLPWDMRNKEVTFVIDGKQLYVYLVTDQGKEYGTPPVLKTWISKQYVTYEIYPSSKKY